MLIFRDLAERNEFVRLFERKLKVISDEREREKRMPCCVLFKLIKVEVSNDIYYRGHKFPLNDKERAQPKQHFFRCCVHAHFPTKSFLSSSFPQFVHFSFSFQIVCHFALVKERIFLSNRESVKRNVSASMHIKPALYLILRQTLFLITFCVVLIGY